MRDLLERRAVELERNESVGGNITRGALLKVPSRTAAPTASSALRYRILVVQGTPDEFYVCLRNASGTWEWRLANITWGVAGYPLDVDFSAEADGSATTVARSDHRHALTAPDATPSSVDATAAAIGTGGQPAREDHRHQLNTHSHQSAGGAGGQLDHGLALTGLTDDDHTQYLKEKASGGAASEVPEHAHDAAAQGGLLNAIAAFANRESGTQTLTTATETDISLDGEQTDTDSFHDNATNPDRITIPAGLGGVYLIGGMITYAANATGYRKAIITVNAFSVTEASMVATSAFDQTVVAPPRVRTLSDGDIVRLRGYQNSGGDLTVNAGAHLTGLWITRLGSA